MLVFAVLQGQELHSTKLSMTPAKLNARKLIVNLQSGVAGLNAS